jgi:hypothetical protein
MTKASPITTEGTRLCQCVHGAPSTGIWSLATADAGTNRGYRKVRGARAGRLRSKNLVRSRSRQQHDAAREPLGKDRFNMSMRKFLKNVGVTSQQAIEEAMRAAGADKTAGQNFKAEMLLRIEGLDLEHRVEGSISGKDD